MKRYDKREYIANKTELFKQVQVKPGLLPKFFAICLQFTKFQLHQVRYITRCSSGASFMCNAKVSFAEQVQAEMHYEPKTGGVWHMLLSGITNNDGMKKAVCAHRQTIDTCLESFCRTTLYMGKFV